MLSPQRGIINYLIIQFGGEPVYFFDTKGAFQAHTYRDRHMAERRLEFGDIYCVAFGHQSEPLRGGGDGRRANRLQKAWHISIPSIIPVIIIMFILRLGGILDAGFDQIFNLYNPLVYEVGDIIDTYVYRVGLIDQKFDFTTAVGLFKNVVGINIDFDYQQNSKKLQRIWDLVVWRRK